jgi:hypothetical protein
MKKTKENNKCQEYFLGTFIDINNAKSLKKYSRTSNGNNSSVYSPKENVLLPEQIATNWIIENKNFEILKEEIDIPHGNNHDEDCYIEHLKYTTNFQYINCFSEIKFTCKKNNDEFILIPGRKNITINDIRYTIPVIKIYNYNPKKLGLFDIEKIK